MLHLLLEYAEQADLAAAPGFKKEPVRWLVQFDLDGTYVGVTRRGDKKSRGDLFRVPRLSQPEMKAGGTGTRHFLCDSAEVVALVGSEEKADPKLLAKHAFFVDLLRKASEAMPTLSRVADALSDPATLKRLQQDLTEYEPPAKPTDNMTFYVTGHEPPLLIESQAWHEWYAQFRASLAKNTSARRMISFAGGVPVTPAKTHPKISGLSGVGGIAMGDVLASFKQDAFRHFGLEQSENAAVSEEEAAAYRAAMNALIRDRSRNLANARIVYWYAGPAAKELNEQPENDPLPPMLPMAQQPEEDEETLDEPSDPDHKPAEKTELNMREEAQQRERLVRLLDAVRTGQRSDLEATRFHALSLAANSGRVVVRDWMQESVADLAENIIKWIDDLSIVRLDNPIVPDRVPKLESLVTCVLSPRPQGQKYDDWVKPAGKLREPLFREAIGLGSHRVLAEAVRMLLPRWQASILNGQFDDALGEEFGKATEGNRMYRGILYARVSLMKAFLIRQGVHMEPCLFEDHPEPAYHCGRLLAVLADLQRTALGDVGAGVVQRYYARASTAPVDALGPLITLSNRHLDKISDRNLADYLQGRIADIWGRICKKYPPKTLDAVGQTLFAMGFYQQIARMRHERFANSAKKRQREQENLGEAEAVATNEEGD